MSYDLWEIVIEEWGSEEPIEEFWKSGINGGYGAESQIGRWIADLSDFRSRDFRLSDFRSQLRNQEDGNAAEWRNRRNSWTSVVAWSPGHRSLLRLLPASVPRWIADCSSTSFASWTPGYLGSSKPNQEYYKKKKIFWAYNKLGPCAAAQVAPPSPRPWHWIFHQ